jgi:hypothetical protein
VAKCFSGSIIVAETIDLLVLEVQYIDLELLDIPKKTSHNMF